MNNKVPILTYHDISNKINNNSIHYKKFFSHINLMRKLGYKSINLSDLNKGTKEKKFIITFDDAYENVAKYALPFLKKNNFKATCFIVTKSIGKYNFWDHHQPNYIKKNIMSLNQIKLWISAGLEVGSHTLNHLNLIKLNKKEKTKEIIGPIEYFKKKGIDIKTFSYPFGSYDKETVNIVKKYYDYAVTTDRGRYNVNNFKNSTLPRVPINYDTSLFKLFIKTSTFYEDIK